MKTMLIIDDESEILTLLEYLFTQLNYRVHTASQKMLLGDVRELTPDVVLLDNRLGTEFGSDLCAEIKTNPTTQHIPVVILSSDERVGEIARLNHADAWLSKPFDIGELNMVVSKVLRTGKS